MREDFAVLPTFFHKAKLPALSGLKVILTRNETATEMRAKLKTVTPMSARPRRPLVEPVSRAPKEQYH